MAIMTGTVQVGADDYDDASSTNTTIRSRQLPNLFIDQDAYFKLHTDVSGGTITAATVYWYDDYHAKVGKSTNYQGDLQVLSGGTIWVTIYSFDQATAPSTGWKNEALTSGEIAHLVDDGTSTFKMHQDTPAVSDSREWYVRAYEYTGVFSAYIVLEYDEPVVPQRRQRIFVM